MAVDDGTIDPLRAATRPGVGNGGAEGGLEGEEPIIIDLGKKSKKQVNKLRKGKPSRLLRRVEDTVEQLRASGEIGEHIKPIIIVVRQRQRQKGRRAAKLWGLG
ncbi:hypothetical protein [Polyangium aurulentum]|uniref:DUF6200 domain-containing protein n=1 Tax=Polyangium aurulentum TaxID=2567896 RepID=UPI0010ADF770|nr:hypothetical protein [Polyangium aurulentum]UQA57002.1 hypothetical protein E8A73_037785 [Polyangium aurulentum]